MTLKKPIWTEGLFVTQHHFQQADRYHECLLDERLRALGPHMWGIQSIELDERALGSGQLKVRELVGIMPDGTPIGCSDQEGDAPPPRNVEGLFPANLDRLPIYLGVSHARENAPNIGSEAKGLLATRFLEHTARVVDFNTGTDEHEFSWARPSLRILIGDEQREAFDVIPVAELIRQPSGGLTFNPIHVPPVLEVRASPYLMERFRRILTAMTARQRALMSTRRQRTQAAVETQASDVAKFWLLDALNQFIPVFAHLTDHGTMAPEGAYLILSQLIGRLCTMAVDGDPTAIPKFNYLALGEVFDPMCTRALLLIETVIAERYTEIPLQRRDDGMNLGQVQDASVLRQDWFLAASGGITEAELRDRLPKLMKVASWGQIGPLLSSAVNGVRLEVEYRPPGALPVKPGVVFFRLQRTPDYWPEVQGTGTIALYHPLGSGVELSLYAVEAQSQ